MLPRTHQLIILILGLCLAGLLGWRAVRMPAAAPTLPHFFVATSGNIPRPGLRVFSSPPTLAQVWQAAGGEGEITGGDQPLPSGAHIIVTPDRGLTITTLPGADLITLGLTLDLNQAQAADLEAIPGLGPVLARRIIAFRESQGPFRDRTDLLQVPGIGPKLLEKISPYVVIIGLADPGGPERPVDSAPDLRD